MAKAMYIGVKSKSYTLTNLAPTINGTTGWSGVNGTISSSTSIKKYGAASMSLTATASQAEVYATNTTNINIQKAHTYYIAYYYYATGKFNTNAYLPVNTTAIGHTSTTAAAANTWYRHGVVYNYAKSSLPSATFSSSLRLDFNNNKVAGTMYFDGLMVIDLTEAFGSGNEPDATWCNANIPYFTGKTKVEKASSTSVARKVKKMYIGVNGVARRVKKAYIGVGGKARCFFSSGVLSYYGTAANLNYTAVHSAATHVGDYAIFAGGYAQADDNGTHIYGSKGTAYNSSLTRTSLTELSTARHNHAATHVGNYALFGGGYDGSDISVTDNVETYNSSLTHSVLSSSLYYYSADHNATHIGNYAVFGSGDGYRSFDRITAFNSSLSVSYPNYLSDYKADYGAASNNNYAIFAGGYDTTVPLSLFNSVDAFNSSMTKSVATPLGKSLQLIEGTKLGEYAVFAGGTTGANGYKGASNTVYAYDGSLTQTTLPNLSVARLEMGAAHIGNYAIFAGGRGSDSSVCAIVDAYDLSLTRTSMTELGTATAGMSATHIGDYALFGGGYTGSLPENSQSKKVYVYTV